jgi:hypothetical protein
MLLRSVVGKRIEYEYELEYDFRTIAKPGEAAPTKRIDDENENDWEQNQSLLAERSGVT